MAAALFGASYLSVFFAAALITFKTVEYLSAACKNIKL